MKEMETHSSILAWEIPWTEKLGGHSPCHKRVGHNLATKQQQLTSPDDQQILCHFPLKHLLLVIYKDYTPY